MWPGRDPIGRRVQHRFNDAPTWVTVVGVAEETRMTRMTGDNPYVLYVPLAQSAAPEGPGAGREGRRRRRRRSPPCGRVRARARLHAWRSAGSTTLDAVVAGAVAEPLRLRFFLSVLGALALVIGAVGIYSVVSYSVTRRRAEFGVRLALGAAPRRILVGGRAAAGCAGGHRRRRRRGRHARARLHGRPLPLRRRADRRGESGRGGRGPAGRRRCSPRPSRPCAPAAPTRLRRCGRTDGRRRHEACAGLFDDADDASSTS